MKMISESEGQPQAGVWTISNLLSLSRIILAIPIVLLLLDGKYQSRLWAVLIMLAAVMTDFLDGYIARQRREVTELGKIIDPLADKIGIVVIAVVLAIARYIPVWFFVLILFRDALILAGGMWLMHYRKIVLQSNWTGKWTVSAIAATIVIATLRIHGIVDILMGISCLLIVWSSVVYGQRFIEVLRGKK
jgi:CDP-diacylglycerol--glycerol-3-phosphate 3-phosphatidyltransferase